MKTGISRKAFFSAMLIAQTCFPISMHGQNNQAEANILQGILNASPELADVLKNKDSLNIQIIYTQIDRTKKNKAKFTDHSFNISDTYFYPASTVKLPVAILALQKLNELKIPGLDKNTTMITESDGNGQSEICNDPSAADGRPTIAHYIKKILLVSDNDAFNRLYEFLGQEYINNSLHKMGYSEAQIIHRLSISLSEEQNRHTNPVKFIDTAGNVLYQKTAEKSQLVYAKRDTKLGNGYIKDGQLVNAPFDFSKKNRVSLQTLHSILKAVLFPASVPEQQRFSLTNDDLDFLRKYMSMQTGESVSPVYDTKEYWDNYVKLIYYGIERTKPLSHIRIFNKPGWSYGFLTDVAYIADMEKNIEFFVSAVIYCNSDHIFNDDKYDYRQVGYPFLKQLGQILYEHELKRSKKHTPNLSTFKYDYGH